MAKTSYTPEEAARLLEKYLTDLVVIENAVGRWRMDILQLAQFGAASCGMIKAYNQAAINAWVLAKDSLGYLRQAAAGTSAQAVVDRMIPPYPPEPTLYGYRQVVVGGLKSVVLDCTSDDETIDPRQLKMFGTAPGWPCELTEQNPSGQTLQAAPVAPMVAGICAGGPQATGCLIAGGIIIAIGLVGLLIVKKVADILISADKINLERAKQDYVNNERRVAYVRDCVAEYTMKGGDPAKLLDVRKACEQRARQLLPGSKAPYAKGLLAGLVPLAVAATIIVVAVVAGKAITSKKETVREVVREDDRKTRSLRALREAA